MDLFANHLDTIETHLLQEIAARSNHFFEAAGIVADLRSTLTQDIPASCRPAREGDEWDIAAHLLSGHHLAVV